MDEFEKKAMQELHIKIMHCLEPSQLHDYLFQEDIIPEDFLFKLRQQCRIPTEISRLFIMHLKKHCPFHVFLIALRQDNAYSFLAKELEGKLEEIKSQRRIVHLQRSFPGMRKRTIRSEESRFTTNTEKTLFTKDIS